MKRVLAAFVIIAALLVSPANAGDNIRSSAQPLLTSVNNGDLHYDLMANETLMGVEITGLAAAGATLTVEGSTDGRKNGDAAKVWFATVAIPYACPSPSTFTTVATDGPFKIDVSGLTNIRFRVSSVGTGTALVSVNGIPASTLGSCGGTGGGGSGGSVNIHDSAGNNLTSTGGALNVAGTFSATLGGFTPSSSGARMTPLTVQVTDSSQTLPTGAVSVVSNVGTTNPMYCNVNGVAATTADQLISPSSWFAFTIPATITTLHCIATGGTTTADAVGGAGLPTGAGGGGGGSGTFTWPGTAGNAAGNATTAGTMPYVNAYSVGATPAGSNSIGTVGLNAGSNAIGSITNTTFGISGTLPAFTSTPTVNLGTLGGAATAANQEVTAAGTTATSAQGIQGVTGGVPVPVSGTFSASTSSFQSNGGYLNIPSITNVSSVQNFALPSGTNVVLWNYGGYKIAYQLTTSGVSGVTVATADGLIQPGCTVEVAVGSNTNISVGTTAATLTSSMQIVGGTGLWTGASCNNLANGQTALTAPSFATEIGALDNSSLMQPLGVTAAGTSSTKGALAIQGITSGVPIPISGTVTASFSQFAPNGNYATLTVGGTSSRVALPTGTTVAVYNTGSNPAFVQFGSASVVATATNDQVAPGGFSCFAVGSNVDIAAIETAGATTLNISGGAGGCAGSGGGGGGSANVFQATAFAEGDTSSSATTQQIAASGSLTVYLVNYSISTDAAAAGNGTFQIIAGTGSNCATVHATLTPVWTFGAGAGIQEGSLGTLGQSTAGDALCVKTTTTNTVHWRLGVVQQ